MAFPRSLVLALVAGSAALAGLLTASYVLQPRTQELTAGTLLQQPRALPAFSLTDARGASFGNAELAGQWSIVFVGFTHCPDICPNTLGLLKSVTAQLEQQQRSLRVVLLSVDPQRDTPEVLGRYVEYFNPAFVGVTGPEDQLTVLGQAMGFVFARAPGPTAETYTVDHSSALILINPQGQVAGYFTPPLKIDALVSDLSGLIPSA